MDKSTIYGALAIPFRKIDNKVEFLLLKHKSGMWTFPGGGMDEEDLSLEDCLIREIKEEIGLSVKKDQLIPTNLINKFVYGPEKPSRNGMRGETHYWGLELRGDEEFSSWDNIADFAWLDKNEVIKRLDLPDMIDKFNKISELLTR